MERNNDDKEYENIVRKVEMIVGVSVCTFMILVVMTSDYGNIIINLLISLFIFLILLGYVGIYRKLFAFLKSRTKH